MPKVGDDIWFCAEVVKGFANFNARPDTAVRVLSAGEGKWRVVIPKVEGVGAQFRFAGNCWESVLEDEHLQSLFRRIEREAREYAARSQDPPREEDVFDALSSYANELDEEGDLEDALGDANYEQIPPEQTVALLLRRYGLQSS